MSDDTIGEGFPWEDTWPEIRDSRVRAAFAKVPRTEFVDELLRHLAGRDAPLPIGEGQTISQPFVVALMVQALALHPGEKVLEIGAGSGFQTAILCEMTRMEDERAGQSVYAIERHASLARRAGETLARLGYAPHLTVGDGALGWPEEAPFAAIIVSAAAEHIPRPLWEQLDEGGRMVVPVGGHWEGQELWLIRKEEGRMRVTFMGGVQFVPLISPIMSDPEMWAEGN